MSMKVTESLRKPHRPKFPKHSKKWEEARAARKERRAGLKQQPRDPLGFVIYTDRVTGEQRVKPDSRRAHEAALMDKQLSDEINAASRKRRTKKEDSK